MLNYKFTQLIRQNKRVILTSSTQFHIQTPYKLRFFSTQNQQNTDNKEEKKNEKFTAPKNMHKQILFMTLATGLIMVGSSRPGKQPQNSENGINSKNAEAEGFDQNREDLSSERSQKAQVPVKIENQQPPKEQQPLKSEEGKLFSSVFRKTLDQFEIPKLLAEREKQKMKEYEEREETDISFLKDESGKKIDISPQDYVEMKRLDSRFGMTKDQYDEMSQEEKIEMERASYIQDPYAQQQAMKMKHQEYRTIKIGPSDLLKNGQMVQVSVCDPFDEEVFHPTDKVIIMKHNNLYYATGSFCGFDYTNLATGVFLGEKLICPTCGSVYNVMNGFVDQGPSMRNISSFLVQNREEKIQVVIPEHVPAFSLKNHLKKSIIDPRTYVVVGDSETALSVIDALRTSFTGRIICIPSSAYGSFENVDILNRSFEPLQKNQLYYVEKDYMDRANIEVLKGEVSQIDFNKKVIRVKGQKNHIEFDKIMIAWGSYKKRLNSSNETQFSNVYYLEDRYSHAKCHNQILRAKTILVMGSTFEAYQTAASMRDYLDSIDYRDVEIILMDSQLSEVQLAFGPTVSKNIHDMLKQQRISVLMDADIQRFQGIDKLEGVYFKKKNPPENEKHLEYFIKPDLVIAENGVGSPKMDLQSLLTPDMHSENNEPPIKIGIDSKGIPSSDTKFSLHYNDIHSPIFAAGSCTSYPSFLQKVKVRTSDVKYNIESGFYAAMNMLDKRVEFRYIPMESLKIGDTPIYFIGERNQPFHEIIINGDVESGKYVVFYVYGREVCGVVTVGYQNLHLYLWEAFRLMIMPAASQLRSQTLTYKDIVKAVLKSRPMIKCKRSSILGIPSMTLSEFDDELQRTDDFNRKLTANIKNENEIQKKKFMELKEKYDREGVEHVEDEMEMVDEGRRSDNQEKQTQNRAKTRKGFRKPGEEDSGNMLKTKNVNMGGDGEGKNPFNFLLNMAKGNIKD